ncbi:Hypothetical predicted protein [Mytilus galloprovincialis]|uniref:Uncharacterized protein n=1 Tax=Mytilus galloprovincialis TaxID=29158 RepID=A0A8B6E3V5_MYTGA|nr:Hypothetical predicted protein [Mytilus galloprovincialis]
MITHVFILLPFLALHSEKNESSSDDDDDDDDDDDFYSIPSEDETLRFKESNAVEDMNDAPEMKDAQSAMTSDHMERKSDKVEASQSSSGVTASMERKSDKVESSQASSGVTASMERKSDKVEASQSSSGVTASTSETIHDTHIALAKYSTVWNSE